MLRLHSATDPTWASVCMANLDALLVDHAHCEHKAAATALSFITKWPDDPVLISTLAHLASEEASHLERVAEECARRGLALGRPSPDAYVKGLLVDVRNDPVGHRVDRLLVSAVVEARSCERLQLLAAALPAGSLQCLYDELWRVEASHHMVFATLATRTLVRLQGLTETDATTQMRTRAAELFALEARVVSSLPVEPRIH